MMAVDLDDAIADWEQGPVVGLGRVATCQKQIISVRKYKYGFEIGLTAKLELLFLLM